MKDLPERTYLALPALPAFDGSRCPEMQPLTGAIRACLDATGENFGFVDLGGWRLDRGMIYCCTLSAEAYGGDASVLCDRNTLENSLSGTRALLDGLGYGCEVYSKDPARADYLPEAELRARVLAHLSEKKRPLVTDGFWNCPMGYAVVGYEDWGETLVGWNYHVFDFSHNPAPVTEKKAGWYEDATFFLLLGERRGVPDERELCGRIIRASYEYLTDGSAMSNAGFYGDLKRFLLQSEDECIREAQRTHKIMGYLAPPDALFDDAEAVRAELFRIADPLWCSVSERRYYAGHFFRLAREYFPVHAEKLSDVARSFDEQSRLFGDEYIKEVGHDPVDREKFRDMDVRARMAEVVARAERAEGESVRLLAELIREMGE